MTQTNILGKKGLTDFQLKYIAMVLMILDHTKYFFEFTGKIPEFFSMLGRISAPIFLFCLIEGFVHTHNRKKYFLQVYAIAIVMGLIQFSFQTIGRGLVRPDGFWPANQMLASFSILIVVLQGFEWCKEKKWIKGLAAILVPIVLWPAAVILLLRMVPASALPVNILAYSFLPVHIAITDGGTPILVAGIVMYLTRKHRIAQVIGYSIVVILFDIVSLLVRVPNITVMIFLTQAYQWMEIFSIFFMLAYNGQRGHGSKKLFYWFYPVHVYVLYALSCLLYMAC